MAAPRLLVAAGFVIAWSLAGCGARHDGGPAAVRRSGGAARATSEGGASNTSLLPYDERAPRLVAQRRVARVLHLTPPFQAKTSHFLDGGTLGFTIRDGLGRTLRGALPASHERDSLGLEAVARGDSVVMRPLRAFYLGADHPERPGARPLAVAGDEERALLDLFDLVAAQYVRSAVIDILMADCSGRAWLSAHYRVDSKEFMGIDLGLVAAGRRLLDPNGIRDVLKPEIRRYYALELARRGRAPAAVPAPAQ